MSARIRIRRASDNLIVFMHGLGCSKEAFDDAFERPELDRYSILTFDFPGHGSSVGLPESSYSLEKYAAFAANAIDQVRPKKLTIVGHSMGGAVAVLLCDGNKFDNRLRALINVEGNLISEDCGIVSRGIAGQTWTEFHSRGHNGFLERLSVDSSPAGKAWYEWSRRCHPVALHAMSRELVQWSDSGKLIEIYHKIPNSYYLCGDITNPLSYLAPCLPRDRNLVVHGSGHFPMIDNADQFYGFIGDILKRRD
ncbi:alpha/beta fold hydrolase [Nocardia sp. NPDC004582]